MMNRDYCTGVVAWRGDVPLGSLEAALGGLLDERIAEAVDVEKRKRLERAMSAV
jgi:hypothetical protein